MNPWFEELRRLDWFRRSPSRLGGAAGHKEWQHFLLHSQDVHLIVNFSLIDGPGGELARVIVLAFDGSWHGAVERLESGTFDIAPGEVGGTFGGSTLELVPEGYRVQVRLQQRPITLDLLFTPTSEPSQINNQPLGSEHLLSWLVVPRLTASGTVRLGDVEHEVRHAQAYHDHNWGHFDWGGDFCWEWGALLPEGPDSEYCAVFSRLMDRGRTRVFSQGFLLWRGDRLVRLFRDGEVSYRSERTWRAPRPFQIPRVLSVLAPHTAADLPAELHVTGTAGDDHLQVVARPRHLARVLLPSERDPVGLALLNEVLCDVEMTGTVDGQPVLMEGRGVLEFVR